MPRKAKKTALRSALVAARAARTRSSSSKRSRPTARPSRSPTALAALDAGAKKALIVDAKDNEHLVRGAKNLAPSQWLAPEGVNVYDILRHETLVAHARPRRRAARRSSSARRSKE